MNVVSNLANTIPTIEGNIFKYMKGNYTSSMNVTETNRAEIFNIVNFLKMSSSTGSDGIPGISKSIISTILLPPTHIFKSIG